MSLTKKPTMTQKRVAANRANGKHSHGPATTESACEEESSKRPARSQNVHENASR